MRNSFIIVLFGLVIAVIIEVLVVFPLSKTQVKDNDEYQSISIANGRRTPVFKENIVFSSKQLLQSNNFSNVVNSTIRDNSNALTFNSLLFFTLRNSHLTYYSPRLISNLAYIISTMLFGLLAFFIFDSLLLSIISVLLFSSHSIIIQWAATGRAYSLAVCLVIASTLFLWQIIKQQTLKPSLTLPYLIICLFAFFTHYYTVLIIGGGGLMMLLFIPRIEWWKIFRLYFLFLSICGLWFVSGAYLGWEIIMQANHSTQQEVHGWTNDVVNVANRAKFVNQLFISFINERFHWQFLGQGIKARYLYLLAALPFFVITLASAMIYFRRKSLKQPLTMLLLFSGIPVFNFLLTYVVHNNVALFPKFSIFSIPFFILLFVYTSYYLIRDSKILGTISTMVLATYVLIYLTIIVQPLPKGKLPEDDYVNLANLLTQSYKAGDVIIFPTWDDANFTSLYLPADISITESYNHAYRGDEAVYISRSGKSPERLYNLKKNVLRYSWE